MASSLCESAHLPDHVTSLPASSLQVAGLLSHPLPHSAAWHVAATPSVTVEGHGAFRWLDGSWLGAEVDGVLLVRGRLASSIDRCWLT